MEKARQKACLALRAVLQAVVAGSNKGRSFTVCALIRIDYSPLLAIAMAETSPVETGEADASAGSSNCVFCRIAAKDEQASILYEDADFVCFRDRSPAATHHYLLIPRLHLRSVLKMVHSI